MLLLLLAAWPNAGSAAAAARGPAKRRRCCCCSWPGLTPALLLLLAARPKASGAAARVISRSISWSCCCPWPGRRRAGAVELLLLVARPTRWSCCWRARRHAQAPHCWVARSSSTAPAPHCVWTHSQGAAGACVPTLFPWKKSAVGGRIYLAGGSTSPWKGSAAAAGGRIYVAGSHEAEAVHPDARDDDRTATRAPDRKEAASTLGQAAATTSEGRAMVCGKLDPDLDRAGQGS